MNTILLIDDSRFQRTANEQILRQAGYRVIAAEDGEQALRNTLQYHPDLILLDMLLPKMGGQDVLQCLQGDPVTKVIPVIVLTGLPEKNAKRLMQAGAAAFLEKGPVLQNPELLLRRVGEILSRVQVSAAQIRMRGDLEVCWRNREAPQRSPVYQMEFFPTEDTGTGPKAYTLEGRPNLEQHLSQFGISTAYLDGWLKQLDAEDIVIPYVGITEGLCRLYGI